mmetsp:Transcript_65323/g.142323  ORF Transcript_65323/g.142323 Transcript_65323/m.142323 type:complete len:463 (-) Transcript_65323:171-1559(-)
MAMKRQARSHSGASTATCWQLGVGLVALAGIAWLCTDLQAWAVLPATARGITGRSANPRFGLKSSAMRSSATAEPIALQQTMPAGHDRIFTREEVAAQEKWIVIRNSVYDLGGYLRKHPGGKEVLARYFNGGNATESFDSVGHSRNAVKMLEKLKVGRLETAGPTESMQGISTVRKFFTVEDRFNLHKSLGIYVLLHYAYRMWQVLVRGNPTAGFDGSWLSLASVLPHALLSSSSFIFHVPRERVVERPMIWQEFRGHNVCFALRSFVAFVLLWATEHAWTGGRDAVVGAWRGAAVCGSAAAILIAMLVADTVTRRLRVDSRESTTATMPYWEGSSARTQARFKLFYAYAQILATFGVLSTLNLSWPFIIMLPIQLASLLMTCVRKGALSTRGYHLIYTGSLVVPFLVGLRSNFYLFSLLGLAGTTVFCIRQLLPRGTTSAKYKLWSTVAVARVAVFAGTGV